MRLTRAAIALVAVALGLTLAAIVLGGPRLAAFATALLTTVATWAVLERLRSPARDHGAPEPQDAPSREVRDLRERVDVLERQLRPPALPALPLPPPPEPAPQPSISELEAAPLPASPPAPIPSAVQERTPSAAIEREPDDLADEPPGAPADSVGRDLAEAQKRLEALRSVWATIPDFPAALLEGTDSSIEPLAGAGETEPSPGVFSDVDRLRRLRQWAGAGERFQKARAARMREEAARSNPGPEPERDPEGVRIVSIEALARAAIGRESAGEGQTEAQTAFKVGEQRLAQLKEAWASNPETPAGLVPDPNRPPTE